MRIQNIFLLSVCFGGHQHQDSFFPFFSVTHTLTKSHA